ncbi:chaperone binding protein, putative [Entamoeba invadens IP1]|uniref:chaperone binding protein, putative n=1 Tax=Entamoeba invadens IP1 TaxID=370355 RepID=UPI0002C3ECF9|nr:chaperone binding protein, putative [Entamoeba invadens IP1]ELP93562.1 chaperone binding protein, putative [Entamoeba invadens IP1]|eukprot:XP_004260333.1 chaperone binding protein, putative [Entamoeba invadens IP1]
MSLRYDWYQQGGFVIIDVFEKNVPKENVKIDFEEEQVTIEVKVGEETKTQIIDNLFGAYDTAASTYRVGKVKIEIKLKKKDGANWDNLTKGKESHHQESALNANRKDWDAINKQADEELKDVHEGGPNAGFQDLYRQATEEQRRAMNKSFVESGGTVLNMNWEEVEHKKFDVSAPEHAELKTWGKD